MKTAMIGFSASGILAATEASSSGDSAASWASLVIRELGRSQTAGFLLDLVQWTFLGALLGVAIAVVACVVFSRMGWYDIHVRFARGLRWTVFTATVLLAVVMAGFWSGAMHGSESA